MCFGCIYIVSYLWNYWDFIMVTPFKKHRSIGIFTSYVKQYMYFQVIYRQNQNRFFLTFFSFLLWTMMWNICINQAAKGQQWFHEQKWCGFFFFSELTWSWSWCTEEETCVLEEPVQLPNAHVSVSHYMQTAWMNAFHFNPPEDFILFF